MTTDPDETQAWAARLEADVDDLTLAVQELRDQLDQALTGGTVRAPEPTLAEVEAWVRDELRTVYARPVNPGWRWCPRWSDHPEAVLRLRALLTGWRDAQRTGQWLPYLRDLDAQMAALTQTSGTFAACGQDHNALQPLPLSRP